jgi:glycerate kinase
MSRCYPYLVKIKERGGQPLPTRLSDCQVRHFTDFRETFLIGDDLAKQVFGDQLIGKSENDDY